MNKLYIQSTDLTSLLIEPTGYCNANCPHCPRYTDDGYLHDYIPEEHLTIDAFRHGLNQKNLTNLQVVNFAGATGDPIMNPNIEDLIEFFNFVPSIRLDTNGSIRNPAWWSRLARFSNLTVVWSIDGLEDTNCLYRIGTDYQTIISNAQAYISSGGNAVWKCIIFKHNQHQIAEVKKTAKAMGFKGIQFVKAYDYRFQEQKVWPVMVKGTQLHTISPSSLSEDEITAHSIDPTKIHESSGKLSNILCPWMKNRSAYINLLGELMPCCMMTHETTNNYPGSTKFKNTIGNFKNISLYHNTMDEIFKNYYGSNFNQSLMDVNTMQDVCAKSCKNAIVDNSKIIGFRVPTKNHDNN